MKSALAAIGVTATVVLVAFVAFTTQDQTAPSFLAQSSFNGDEKAFLDFIAEFGRDYETRAEFLFRFSLFRKTLSEINAHTDPAYTQVINDFADWTDAEFK